MGTTYEICSGSRSVARQTASTAHEALVEYLRSLGCHDDELVRAATDAISWRGAVYKAAPLIEANRASARRAA